MKRIILVLAVLAMFAAVVGAGCIGTDPIVGEWTFSGGAEPLPTIIFNDDGTGHYKAVFGHDDLVMTMVQMTFVKNTLQYQMMKNDFDSQIEIQQHQQDSNYDIYGEPWGEDIYDLDIKGNVGRLNRFINQF